MPGVRGGVDVAIVIAGILGQFVVALEGRPFGRFAYEG